MIAITANCAAWRMFVEMNPSIKIDRAAWLQGPSAECSVAPRDRKNPWRLVLLGAPGVGKGTQAELLTGRLQACHLSTGDVFRAASQRRDCDQSPAMKAALEYMRRGELVPDSTVWDMVRERSQCILQCDGFILDGFPRTLTQAELLKELMEKEQLSLSAVVNYELPVAEIVQRLSGRRTCEKCKSVFHVTERPSSGGGICDRCGGRLSNAKMTGRKPSPSASTPTNEAPRRSSSSIRVSVCCCRLLPKDLPTRSWRVRWRD